MPESNIICFYNPAHFGDIMFASPFIRHICLSNPNRKFCYFSFFGNYIFKGEQSITNLRYLVENDSSKRYETIFANIRYEISKHMNDRFFLYKIDNIHSVIMFNVWCAALECKEDVIFQEQKTGIMKTLDMINTTHNDSYVNTPVPDNKIMPIVDIPNEIYINNGFISWMNNFKSLHNKTHEVNNNLNENKHKYDTWIVEPINGNNKIIKCIPSLHTKTLPNVDVNVNVNSAQKLVFIFNFTPRSVSINYNMNETIATLAKSHSTTHTFIVPNSNDLFNLIPNIICCDKMFGYSETELSFYNIFVLERIVRSCDIIITQFCGASWIWFNEHLLHYYRDHKNPIYITNHESTSNDYALKMNNWFKTYYNSVHKTDPSLENTEFKEILSFVNINDLSSIL
jgi:hypothetical protein